MISYKKMKILISMSILQGQKELYNRYWEMKKIIMLMTVCKGQENNKLINPKNQHKRILIKCMNMIKSIKSIANL